MVQENIDQRQPPPGIISTITTGFEFTTRHIWLLLIPIALDLFYWLGPRLNITRIVAETTSYLNNEPAFAGLVEEILAIAPRINLFTNISIPIVGVPALMGGTIPEDTPINPLNYELTGSLSWMVIFLGLTFLGVGLTTIYLGLISLSLKLENGYEFPGMMQFAGSTLLAVFRLIGLGLAFLLTLFLVTLPLLPIAFVLGLFNSALMIGLFLITFFIVAVYMSLAIPGIIYNSRPIFKSIMESVRLVYRNMLPTVNILLITILVINGTNILWHLADNGTWFTLISIIGHAFISTGLAAAIIIFYRDRYLVFIDATSASLQEANPNG